MYEHDYGSIIVLHTFDDGECNYYLLDGEWQGTTHSAQKESILQLQHCSYDDYLGLADEKNKPEGKPKKTKKANPRRPKPEGKPKKTKASKRSKGRKQQRKRRRSISCLSDKDDESSTGFLSDGSTTQQRKRRHGTCCLSDDDEKSASNVSDSDESNADVLPAWKSGHTKSPERLQHLSFTWWKQQIQIAWVKAVASKKCFTWSNNSCHVDAFLFCLLPVVQSLPRSMRSVDNDEQKIYTALRSLQSMDTSPSSADEARDALLKHVMPVLGMPLGSYVDVVEWFTWLSCHEEITLLGKAVIKYKHEPEIKCRCKDLASGKVTKTTGLIYVKKTWRDIRNNSHWHKSLQAGLDSLFHRKNLVRKCIYSERGGGNCPGKYRACVEDVHLGTALHVAVCLPVDHVMAINDRVIVWGREYVLVSVCWFAGSHFTATARYPDSGTWMYYDDLPLSEGFQPQPPGGSIVSNPKSSSVYKIPCPSRRGMRPRIVVYRGLRAVPGYTPPRLDDQCDRSCMRNSMVDLSQD